MVVLNKNIKYHFNPFGGLSEEEISKVIDPEKHLHQLSAYLENSEPLILELTGKKGRGKTTHLKLLHKRAAGSELFSLKKGKRYFDEIVNSKADLIFIDSIHHLNILQRLKIYGLRKQVVYTTHFTRWFEVQFSNNNFISCKIKGISMNNLTEMIINRIQIAATEPSIIDKIELDTKVIKKLMSKHGDDYRGILRELYVNFSHES